MIKKIKNSIYTLVFTLIIYSSSITNVAAGGFPTFDIANIVQQLMNYLNYMQQLQEQIQHTKNQIESLKEISVPSVESLKGVSQLSESLMGLYEQWNNFAKEYNDLNETYNEYEKIDNEMKDLNCSNTGLRCDYQKLEILKQHKMNLIQNYEAKLKSNQKDAKDRKDKILKQKENLIKNLNPFTRCTSTATTSGAIQSCQMIAFEEIMKQNYDLQIMLLKNYEKDLELTFIKDEYYLSDEKSNNYKKSDSTKKQYEEKE